MADMLNGDQLRALKKQHPNAKVLCYVNSTADVKAESDCCVTSSNALAVARSFGPDTEIIFVPDRHLGSYTAEQLGREFILWPGFCPTHARLGERQVDEARRLHPAARILVHPESPKPVRDAADAVLSTGGMIKDARENPATEFVIGTEVGILHRLAKENPGKRFHALLDQAVCPNMKKINLEKILWGLRDMQTVITVAEPIASRARRSIEAMLAIK